MAIENLREIGNVLYEQRADGMLYPIRRLRPDLAPQGVEPSAPGLLSGTGIPERLELANEFLNPVAGVYDAMDSSADIFAPNRTGYERAVSAGDMLSGVAGILAPAVAAYRAGVPVATALMESLLGGSPTTQALSEPVRYATDAADLAARSTLGNIRAIGEGDFDFLRAGGTPQSLSAGSVRQSNAAPFDMGRGIGDNGVDLPNVKRKDQVLVRIPIEDVEHGESALSGGKLTFPGSRSLIEGYARRETPLPPIDIMSLGDEDFGRAFIADGSHRYEAARLRGDNFIDAYVSRDDLADLPTAQVIETPQMQALRIPTDPAAVRGAQIIDMLTSGRADQTPDQMLDMGDPVLNANLNQYLYRNYDLPMDEASRMARAGEMGFNESGYHGTVSGKDFQNFRSDVEAYIAPQSQEGLDLTAQFSTAEQGRVIPVVTRGRILDTSDPSGMFQQRRDAQAIYDEMGLGTFPVRDKNLPSWMDAQAINAARDAGYDGIRLEERDWVNSTAIFDPTDIRSRFARFDPRLSHLKNLSAAAAGTGLLGIGMQDRNADRGY